MGQQILRQEQRRFQSINKKKLHVEDSCCEYVFVLENLLLKLGLRFMIYDVLKLRMYDI